VAGADSLEYYTNMSRGPGDHSNMVGENRPIGKVEHLALSANGIHCGRHVGRFLAI